MMDKMMDRGQHGGQDDNMMDTIIDMGTTRSRVCHGDRLPSSANREDTTGQWLLSPHTGQLGLRDNMTTIDNRVDMTGKQIIVPKLQPVSNANNLKEYQMPRFLIFNTNTVHSIKYPIHNHNHCVHFKEYPIQKPFYNIQ